MNESGEVKEDLKVPEDEWLKPIAEKIRQIFAEGSHEALVSVISGMEMEKVIDCKEGKPV